MAAHKDFEMRESCPPCAYVYVLMHVHVCYNRPNTSKFFFKKSVAQRIENFFLKKSVAQHVKKIKKIIACCSHKPISGFVSHRSNPSTTHPSVLHWEIFPVYLSEFELLAILHWQYWIISMNWHTLARLSENRSSCDTHCVDEPMCESLWREKI